MITKKELGDFLADHDFNDTSFCHFGMKLLLITPTLSREDILIILQSLNDDMKEKIKKSKKQDDINSVSINKMKEQITEYEQKENDNAVDLSPEEKSNVKNEGENIVDPEKENKEEDLKTEEQQKPEENQKTEKPKKNKMFADISGEVKKPGFYEIEDNDRVGHLVNLAGGLTERAAVDMINLSGSIEDGQKIIIPSAPVIKTEDKATEKKEEKTKDKTEDETENHTKNNEEEKSEEKIKKDGFVNIPDKKEVDNSALDFGIVTKDTNIYARPVVKDTEKKNNPYKGFFKWFLSCVHHNKNRLPKKAQDLLEQVDDPVKIKIFSDGYFNGLNINRFKALLAIEKKASVEKLQSLIDFYIKLEKEGSVEWQ